ncbi:MAG: PIG-L family deacetylase [Terracidiphilus sp.]|jgi:LmbE family N-acetylglucosaminyl deacetylase
MKLFPRKLPRIALCAALAALLSIASRVPLLAQTVAPTSPASELAQLPLPEPSAIALPLPEDRGAADLEQTLKRLGTTASVLVIVPHPDDEDGALMTYLSRGLGVRVTLLTLTRGEGGQNAMSAETYDALGLIRTSELLKAGEYYGVRQLWGTEADFGFSKTQEESFQKWGHDRVLYDAVLAIRMVRPQLILSTFVGGLTDGHGQHQVAGEIAQEAFKAAADPRVFPEQLRPVKEGGAGLQPWQPLAVYSRTPFAPITNGQMLDYATGKWAPARFHNYLTGEWIEGALPADVTLPVGTWDPVLGRTYVQIAREGWGEQKSQDGGANPALSGPDSSSYHLWAVAPSVAASSKNKPTAAAGGDEDDDSLFRNAKVNIDTGIAGLARLAGTAAPQWLADDLGRIQSGLNAFTSDCKNQSGVGAAHKLVPTYRETLDLYARVKASDLDAEAKASLEFELGEKIEQFQMAFKDLLGLDLVAFTTSGGSGQGPGGRGASADQTARSVWLGEDFGVRVHLSNALAGARLSRVWLESSDGTPWKIDDAGGLIDAQQAAATTSDRSFHVHVPAAAAPTEPYFTRPTTEQPYYDISNEAWRLSSFAPYPLAAWAEFSFDGVPIRLGQVVQTLARVTGVGGVYQPLVVTPAIGVRVEPEARILPLDGSPLPVSVTVHAEHAADGVVDLKLPEGWRADPAQREFHLKGADDTEPLVFSVSPAGDVAARAYAIQAVAHVGDQSYFIGWQSIGYPGLLPYNQYKPAELRTRKIDVKVAPSLRVGYVMGTGDLVPEAIEALGITPHLVTDGELATADLSQWNVLVIGIRAYSARPGLAAAEPRLESFVERGGTLVVQYQGATFPAALPLSIKGMAERVVDEQAPVKLLDPTNSLLAWPNKITSADFDGWFEERGHGFLDHWDPGYTALTETADPGQDPQRGGLLVAHRGKGTYIYVAFALYRQFPELVPGAYRLMANLLSAGADEAGASASSSPARP